MKKSSLFTSAIVFALLVSVAQAEMVTHFNYGTTGNDKDIPYNSKLMYKAMNSLFGLTGSEAFDNARTFNEQRLLDNPGNISAQNAYVFSVTGYASDYGVFEILGNGGSSVYTGQKMSAWGTYDPTSVFTQSLLSDYTGDMSFKLTNSNGTFYSDYTSYQNINRFDRNADVNVEHYLFFDITDLIDKYVSDLGFEYTSATLVGIEDRAYYGANGNKTGWDGDYNDGMYIVFNNASAPPTTPEPASLLMVGLGLSGLALARRSKNSKAASSM